MVSLYGKPRKQRVPSIDQYTVMYFIGRGTMSQIIVLERKQKHANLLLLLTWWSIYCVNNIGILYSKLLLVRSLLLNHCICKVFVSILLIWVFRGLSWSWPYSSWIYNYLCNHCLSPITLWVQILRRRGVLDRTLCANICQWLAAGR